MIISQGSSRIIHSASLLPASQKEKADMPVVAVKLLLMESNTRKIQETDKRHWLIVLKAI